MHRVTGEYSEAGSELRQLPRFTYPKKKERGEKRNWFSSFRDGSEEKGAGYLLLSLKTTKKSPRNEEGADMEEKPHNKNTSSGGNSMGGLGGRSDPPPLTNRQTTS